TLDAHSELKILSSKASVILRGRVSAQLPRGSIIEDGTGHAVYTNGTEFVVDAGEGSRTTVSVLRGSVTFALKDKKGESVDIGEGFQSSAAPGKPPEGPVRIPSARLLVEWTYDFATATLPRETILPPVGSAEPNALVRAG